MGEAALRTEEEAQHLTGWGLLGGAENWWAASNLQEVGTSDVTMNQCTALVSKAVHPSLTLAAPELLWQGAGQAVTLPP